MSETMANILILVGTESGNAQMVADALKPVLGAAGHTVDVTDKAAARADLEAHDVLLVVCATHGSGDIPTNILPLAETLERERPDLSGHRYGVIALGDMTYQDTYCGGGKKVDRVFELCGAGSSASGSRSTPPPNRCPTRKRWAGSRAGRRSFDVLIPESTRHAVPGRRLHRRLERGIHKTAA
jgi:MioC protein